MIVEFPCPGCGRQLQAREGDSGRKVRCRFCKAVLHIPGPPARKQTEDGDAAFETETRTPSPPALPRRAVPHPDRDAELATTDASASPAWSNDNSYGIASLYLATLSFLFFSHPQF